MVVLEAPPPSDLLGRVRAKRDLKKSLMMRFLIFPRRSGGLAIFGDGGAWGCSIASRGSWEGTAGAEGGEAEQGKECEGDEKVGRVGSRM